MITDRKLLIILCITVVVLMISKYITSEGYALKTNEIKFSWRNKTTDGVTKWVIKLTGGNSDGNLVVLETKEIKKKMNLNISNLLRIMKLYLTVEILI